MGWDVPELGPRGLKIGDGGPSNGPRTRRSFLTPLFALSYQLNTEFAQFTLSN